MTETRSAAEEWKRFWPLPLVAALGYSTATLHSYGLGVFIEPIQQEFQWSRTEITSGLTITGLVGAVLSVPVGMLVDRFGPRIVGLTGVLLMTGSFALLGATTGNVLNWLFLWSVLAISSVFLQATIWTKAVASCFDRSRGLALAVTLSGGAITATILPLIATELIANFGWRLSFVGVAMIWAAVVFPVMFLFFRSGSGERLDGNANGREAKSTSGATFAEALRSPAFYKLVIASVFFAFTINGIIVHFVPILTGQGADRLGAAAVASLIGIFSMIGRLGVGLLLDRLPAQLLGAGICLFPVFSCALLMLDGGNTVVQSVSAALFGFTVGAEVDVIAYLTARVFGLKSYGKIYGAMIGALSIGVAFGPLAASAAHDLYNGYSQFLGMTVAAMTVSAVALASVNTRRFGSHV